MPSRRYSQAIFLCAQAPSHSQRFATLQSLVALLLILGWLSHEPFVSDRTSLSSFHHNDWLNVPRAWLINYTFLTNCCAKHFLLHFPNQHKCTLVFIMAYYCQILVINHNSNISLVCGKVNAGFHLKPPPHKLNFNTYSFI